MQPEQQHLQSSELAVQLICRLVKNTFNNLFYSICNNPGTFAGFMILTFASGFLGAEIDCAVYKHSSLSYNLMYGKFNNLSTVLFSTLTLFYIVYRNRRNLEARYYFLLSCLPALGYIGGSAVLAYQATHHLTLQAMWKYSDCANQLPSELAAGAFFLVIILICANDLDSQVPVQMNNNNTHTNDNDTDTHDSSSSPRTPTS